jgi:hypothetical protein
VSEPPHRDVAVRAFQLIERREELLAITSAECRRFPIDEDRPVRKAAWVYSRPIRLSFSTNVVRFRFNSFAA